MPQSPVIIITGASAGIGASTARLFAQRGYRVVLAARRYERLQALADEVDAQGGQALPVATDMRSLEDVQNLARLSLDVFGQVDVLLNNAGFARLDWLENLDVERDVRAQIETNLTGLVWLTQAVLPHMVERRQGHIINVSSMAGYVATPTYTVYAATKFAVRGFTDALRREVRIHGIRVSGIYPGSVATEFGDVAGIHRTTNITTPDALTLSAGDVAQAVWRTVRRPRHSVVIPWYMRFALEFDALLPGVVDAFIERLFVRPERKAK